MTRIVLLNGHPERAGHFCHALADAYAEGANSQGPSIRRIDVATLEFPILRERVDWEENEPPAAIEDAQQLLSWAQHLCIVHPLWLGSTPALLKAFLEQLFRPRFAFGQRSGGAGGKPMLKGRSARLVVTMGMPALLYRTYFGAHGVKSLESGVLGFVGISPCRRTLIGSVEAISDKKRRNWLDRVHALGQAAR